MHDFYVHSFMKSYKESLYGKISNVIIIDSVWILADTTHLWQY